MNPGVPFADIDELSLDSVGSVLIEDFVDSSSKAFWIGVREVLVVVQKETSVFMVHVERREVFRVIREKDDCLVGAPLEESSVRRLFSELIFCLNGVESPFSKQSLEDASHVLVEKDFGAAHWTVSFGFSDVSRTRSNASSFSCSMSRISSMCL